MSLRTLWYSLTHSQAAHTAVEKIKDDPIGATILGAINEAQHSDKDGVGKMADVLAISMPLVLQLVTKGGVKAVLKDVETLTRNVVESFLLENEKKIVDAIIKAI